MTVYVLMHEWYDDNRGVRAEVIGVYCTAEGAMAYVTDETWQPNDDDETPWVILRIPSTTYYIVECELGREVIEG